MHISYHLCIQLSTTVFAIHVRITAQLKNFFFRAQAEKIQFVILDKKFNDSCCPLYRSCSWDNVQTACKIVDLRFTSR